MVKICNGEYPMENYNLYASHFEKYSSSLSSFQKFAIEAIVEGHTVLVTAPTGSGKTLPADFAIDFFVGQGKRVIYTSPIKALSNNKYYEFSQKYPHISFGVLTGDIKFNPDAQVLLMTTEILQNTLYRKKQNQTTSANGASLLLFEMDFETELGCIIHDEIHFINDAERGKVWEECLMMSPFGVPMVLLSATLDRPEKFATWVESRANKEVYLAASSVRPVPLTHYMFFTCPQTLFKAMKDKEKERQIREILNKPFLLQTAQGEFQEANYHRIKKYLQWMEQHRVQVKRAQVINQLCRYLVENQMLPAVCFILSRKQIEIACKEVTTILLEDDSKVPYIVARECEQILRGKLVNFQEYLELPEYQNLVQLLEKGIAMHHSGMIPIFREIVEILFMKGYIKLLFATETISVGINTPTKTVIFTDVKKFDGTGTRMLLPHEFVQASGRAGRRGLDKVGHVIHLNNLFRNVELTEYKVMMKGKPQTLVSKFRISYHLLLNLIEMGDSNYEQFCRRSMAQDDISEELGGIYSQYMSAEKEYQRIADTLQYLNAPIEVVQRYVDATEQRKTAVNKKRKELDREIEEIQIQYKQIDYDKTTLQKYQSQQQELQRIQEQYTNTEKHMVSQIHILIAFLEAEGLIQPVPQEETTVESNKKHQLTALGNIAAHIREVPCLLFATLIYSHGFHGWSVVQLASLFSCFTSVTVADEYMALCPHIKDSTVLHAIEQMTNDRDRYQRWELENQLETGTDYSMHYDLLEYIADWAAAESAADCKLILQTLAEEKGIFLGEFIKAILKINNISAEMEKVAESIGNMELLKTLQEIPQKTLKFVATNQSLYL